MAEKEYIEKHVFLDYVDQEIKNKYGVGYILGEPFRGNIMRLPAADVVEVRHGEWVEGAEHFTNGFYEAECSVCGNYIRWNEGNSGEWNYCPNCGAKMDGGKDDV